MPKTTVAVNFNGKDNGLSALFSKLSSAVTTLDKQLTSLDNTLARVDARFKSLKSSSSFLSSLGGKLNIGGSGTGIGIGNISSSIGNVKNLFTSGLSNVGGMVRSVFGGVVSTIRSAVANGYQSISNFISYTDKAILMFGNSIRQIAQGIQSFGIAFSIFVSAPLGKILSSVVTEAVEFDDAMNRVKKVTGGTNAEIDSLGEQLTQASLMLTSTREELAKYAEDWGALGVTISSTADAAMMSGLAEWTSKLVMSAEDLTAADVVEKLGKAIILYFPDIHAFDEVKEGIGSVILALEDANNVGASDILSTFQRMAPIAEQMGISMVDALTMSASAASGIASAERAGTELAAALQKVSINTEKAAQATGMEESAIVDLINTDAEGYILSMAYSIAQMSDNVAQQEVLYQQFGVTGGKAIAALVSSWGNVEKNIKIANSAFAEGIYMQMQYAQSLESTKVQLKILSNNATYLGSTIGDALLPYITKFVTLAVPAIQMLAEWFKNLDESVKVQILLWGALLTVAGPIVVFFSSLLFMIGLTISGFSSMFGVLFMIVRGLIGFGGVVLGLLNPINLLVAAIAGIAIYSVFLANDLLMAQGVVQSYISKAYTWGYNLISSFAEGIASAAQAAYNAVMSVINGFIGLIQAFSPPREGPLMGIETWGSNLITAYADGIVSASGTLTNAVSYVNEQLATVLESLSVSAMQNFSSAFNGIKSIINTVSQHIGDSSQTINNKISGAASAVANFISNLRSGIPDDLTEIYEMLGGLGPRYEALIRLQETYSAGEARLKAIQTALKGINSETESLISNVVAQTGLTNDQQSAMIRRIKLEQAAKEQALKREEDSLQVQQDALKEDIDKKQSIIDILSSLIFPGENTPAGTDKVDKPDKPDKGSEITPVEFTPFDKDSVGALDTLKDKFDNAGESAKTFTEKLGDAKAMIEGLLAGLRGDDPKLYSAMPEAFWKGFEKGASIRTSVLDFLTKFNNFVTSLGTIRDVIKDGGLKFLLGVGDGASGGKLNWEAITYMGLFAGSLYVLGYIAGVVGQKVKDVFDYLFTKREGSDEQTPFEQVLTRITNAYNAFVEGFAENTKDIDWTSFGQAVADIAGALGLVATNEGIWKAVGQSLGAILTISTELVIKLARLMHIVALIFGAEDEKRFKEMYGNLKTATDRTDDFWSSADKVYQTFKDIKDIIQEIKDLYNNFMGMFTGKTSQDPSPQTGGGGGGGFGDGSLKDHQSSTGGMYNKGKSAFQDFKDGFADGLAEANDALSTQIAEKVGLGQIIEDGLKVNGSISAGFYLLGLYNEFISDTPVGTAMNEAIASVGRWLGLGDTKDGIDTHGRTFGRYMLGGTGALFTEQTEPDIAMNKLPPAISIWELAHRTIVEGHGQQIGRDITKGTGDITGTDTTYMDTGVWAMWVWINTQWQKLVDIGKSWGSGIIEGITGALRGAGSAIYDAMKSTLDWVLDRLPTWFKVAMGLEDPPPQTKEQAEKEDKNKTQSTTKGRVVSGSLSIPAGTVQNASGGVIININIDNSNGGKMTKDDARNMADIVYKRLIQDGRLMR